MKKNVVIIVLFVILLMILTYPLIFNITTAIPGFFSTDEVYSSIWDSWRIKYSINHQLSLWTTNFISYPFGFDLYSGGYFAYIWMAWHHLLSILTNPVLAHNIQVLFNVLLSGICTCSLVLYLTNNIFSAIIGGIIFAFCPYQFARLWQHLGLTYSEWIPLTLFSAILLREIPSRKHGLLLIISLILLFSFDYVIIYLTFVSLMAYFVYLFLFDWKNKFLYRKKPLITELKYFTNITIIGIFVFILLSPQLLPLIRNRILLSSSTAASAFNIYHRPFEDLFSQSARPLSYFLPAAVHPLFGKFTEQFVGTKLYGISFTEHALYLGWVPLILAFVAFRRWKKVTRSQIDEYFYIGFFVFLAIAAWLFSQPPWWNLFGFKLYMPSFFMYKLLPMYRAYCRFGIVVMLAVAVLAGFGLKFILERFKSNKTKIAVTILACGLVLFEFWNWPPYKIIDISKVPAVYHWLKNQPKDIVIAEYPLDADSPNEMYKFYQTVHEKKMINGTNPGTPANKFAQTILKLSESRTAAALKGMGVSYILVHKDKYMQSGLIEDNDELEKISRNKNLEFIKDFSAQSCPSGTMCIQKTGVIDVYAISADTPEIKPDIKTKI
jgi:hypothetical protein